VSLGGLPVNDGPDPYRDPGIFARIFPRPSAGEVARALAGAGFPLTQLNLVAFGLPSLPDPGGPADRRPDYGAIRTAFDGAGVTIWGLSATFNMIHPDMTRRRRDGEAARELVANAARLGATCVTLCTGTRDPVDMWRAHPANTAQDAWRDLREGLEPLLAAAEAGSVRLGIEPEPGNVVRDAVCARRLLDELGADRCHLGIVLDPANLLTPGTLVAQEVVLGEAFATLGDDVVCLHAKDVVAGGYAAPGSGGLDFDLVYRLRQALPRPVPVVVQDTAEDDTPRVRAMLRDHAVARPWTPTGGGGQGAGH
jgi:sugar phosphate isomerase/epimerase